MLFLTGRCWGRGLTSGWSEQVSGALRSVSPQGQGASAMTTRKLGWEGGEVSARESTETPPPLHLLCRQSSVQGGAPSFSSHLAKKTCRYTASITMTNKVTGQWPGSTEPINDRNKLGPVGID